MACAPERPRRRKSDQMKEKAWNGYRYLSAAIVILLVVLHIIR